MIINTEHNAEELAADQDENPFSNTLLSTVLKGNMHFDFSDFQVTAQAIPTICRNIAHNLSNGNIVTLNNAYSSKALQSLRAGVHIPNNCEDEMIHVRLELRSHIHEIEPGKTQWFVKETAFCRCVGGVNKRGEKNIYLYPLVSLRRDISISPLIDIGSPLDGAELQYFLYGLSSVLNNIVATRNSSELFKR